MNTTERMEALLGYTGLNASSLAKKIDVPKYRIYDITQGRTQSISYEIADKITSCFTTISRDWLLTGEGDMLRGTSVSGDQSVGVNNGSVSNSFNRVAEELGDAIKTAQSQLTASQAQTTALIGELRETHAQISELIQMLKDKQ